MTKVNLTFQKLTEDDWETSCAIEKAVDDGRIFKAYTSEEEAREYLRNSRVWLVKVKANKICHN